MPNLFLFLKVEKGAFTPLAIPEGEHRLQSQYCLWYRWDSINRLDILHESSYKRQKMLMNMSYVSAEGDQASRVTTLTRIWNCWAGSLEILYLFDLEIFCLFDLEIFCIFELEILCIFDLEILCIFDPEMLCHFGLEIFCLKILCLLTWKYYDRFATCEQFWAIYSHMVRLKRNYEELFNEVSAPSFTWSKPW